LGQRSILPPRQECRIVALVRGLNGARSSPRHKDGLASIYVDQWYKVRRDGGAAPVMTVDNWAEPFSDGRARSQVGGKIGYIDRYLKLVVPARYDGAFPFERGVAVVCVGCKLVSDGEHTHYEGGMWGCIDRSVLASIPDEMIGAIGSTQ
jgi:hypothetical protein